MNRVETTLSQSESRASEKRNFFDIGVKKCSARRHLRGADFSVYDAAMQITAHSRASGRPGVCNASVATLSRMTSYAEGTITAARRRLVGSGWLIPLAGPDWVDCQRRSRGRSGQFRTPAFEVIEHDFWAKKNPGACDVTVDGKTRHGGTECGSDRDGGIRETVHGSTPKTVHGKPCHKALKDKPNKEKPKGNRVASRLCVHSFSSALQFLGIESLSASFGRLRKNLEVLFVDYKRDVDCESGCVCSRDAFMRYIMERLQRMKYPKIMTPLIERVACRRGGGFDRWWWELRDVS